MISKNALLPSVWKVIALLAVIFLLCQYTMPHLKDMEAWNSNIVKPAKQIHNQSSVHILGELENVTIPIGEPVRGANSIMFVESSCLVKKANIEHKVMSVRQTCSIESAAKMNPEATVYLLHSCPIKLNPEEPFVKLLEYPNIKFWNISLQSILSGSPLQEWNYSSALNGSQFPLEHSSDVVRLVLLWKYGGLYMDLDFIVIKSVVPLEENFVCAETGDTLANGVMKMNSENPGRRLAEICLHQLAKDFRGDLWSHNGPQRVTNGLKELCQVEKLDDVDPKKCNVTVHKSVDFFPVAYWDWKMLFTTSDNEEVAKRIKESFGVHFWNKLSFEEKVYPGSKQPYSTLAQEFCPLVYSTADEFF